MAIKPSKELVVSATDKDLYMRVLDEAQVNFLLQRTPPEEIKHRQGKAGMQFAYVEHGYVTDMLNKVFGFRWDFEITDRQILDDEVIVEARLTVTTAQGYTIVKTQFGGADIKRHASGPKMGRPLSIADDYKAAGSDALKKCASLLGIGLDLYGRDRVSEEDATPSTQAARPIVRLARDGGAASGERARPLDDFDALPSPLDRKATAQQLEALKKIASSKHGLTPDELEQLSIRQYGGGTDSLSQGDASNFIKFLQNDSPTDMVYDAKSKPSAGKSTVEEQGRWDVFQTNASLYLKKIGCADHLINEVMRFVFADLSNSGTEYDPDVLQATYKEVHNLKTSQEVLVYKNALKGRIDLTNSLAGMR